MNATPDAAFGRDRPAPLTAAVDSVAFRRALLRAVLLLTILITAVFSAFSLRLTLHAIRMEQSGGLAELLAAGVPLEGIRTNPAELEVLREHSNSERAVLRSSQQAVVWGYSVDDPPMVWAALDGGGATRLVVRPARALTSDQLQSAIVRLLITAAIIAWLGFWGGIALTNKVTVALRRSGDRLLHAATHDPLTGLPNRLAFEALQPDPTRTAPAWVLLFDLDGFKEVNDSLGHRYGDDVLCAIARRAEAVVRSLGQVARYGGDEFAVWVPAADEATVVDLAARLHQAMQEPLRVGTSEVLVGASVGYSSCNAIAHDLPGCIERADVAMYAAKERRKGPVAYEPSLDTRSSELLVIRGDLRAALQSGEITLHYQPRKCLRTGAWMGVEALARWQHPTKGWISPARFVAVAERTGLIHELTWYLIEIAASQALAFRKAGLSCPIAVNLSALCLNDPQLPELLADLRDRWDLREEDLEFELTESEALQDPERATASMVRLSRMGFKLALDDFGTGMSSLSYLSKLPIDVLKVDRSFVLGLDGDTGPESARIVEAIVTLGHQLGKTVTAEGVETDEVEAYLAHIGCDLAQGFGIQRPVPGDTVVELMRARCAAADAAP